MWLLPWVPLRVESRLSAEELAGAIQRVTRPDRLQLDFATRRHDDQPFAGEVSKERIRVRWAKYVRNSFQPCVTGRIVDSPPGARIEAVMHLHGIVVGFLAVWMSVAGVIAFIAAGEFFGKRGLEGLEWLAPLAVLAAVYGLCMAAFIPQALQVKRLLQELAGSTSILPEPYRG